MKTILAILIILIICGTAAAQNNINNTLQSGAYNRAHINQYGFLNAGNTIQDGTMNIVRINQIGEENISNASQNGNKNYSYSITIGNQNGYEVNPVLQFPGFNHQDKK